MVLYQSMYHVGFHTFNTFNPPVSLVPTKSQSHKLIIVRWKAKSTSFFFFKVSFTFKYNYFNPFDSFQHGYQYPGTFHKTEW